MSYSSTSDVMVSPAVSATGFGIQTNSSTTIGHHGSSSVASMMSSTTSRSRSEQQQQPSDVSRSLDTISPNHHRPRAAKDPNNYEEINRIGGGKKGNYKSLITNPRNRDTHFALPNKTSSSSTTTTSPGASTISLRRRQIVML